MPAVNIRVVLVASYIVNVWKLGRGNMECLNKVVKNEPWEANSLSKQTSNEILKTDIEEVRWVLRSLV